MVALGPPYSVNVGHNLGFRAVGINNWSLQDITINVAAATGTTDNRGQSVYGVYIRNCNNYNITRCTVFSGPASAGDNGNGATPGYDPVNDPFDGLTGSNAQIGGGGDNGGQEAPCKRIVAAAAAGVGAAMAAAMAMG